MRTLKVSVATIVVALLAVSDGFHIQPRILNGVESDAHKYPFYARLEVIFDTEKRRQNSTCGSTLLSNRWLVTAAHCVYGSSEVYAFLGIDTLGNYAMSDVPISPSNIRVYPKYDTINYDIALLELSSPIELNALIQPINLPTDDGEDVDNYVEAVTMGTGCFDWSRDIDGLLRETNITTSPLYFCTKIDYRTKRKTIICADPENGSAFFGDSGGPLIRAIDNTLIGIVSECFYGVGSNNQPNTVRTQIFAKLYYYIGWIAEVTGLDI